MRYEIVARLQDGQKTVGFQLKSEDGKVININRVQVIQAAAQKMIVNAVYNKRDYQYKDLPNNAVKDIIDEIRYDDKFRVTSLNNAQWINQQKKQLSLLGVILNQ